MFVLYNNHQGSKIQFQKLERISGGKGKMGEQEIKHTEKILTLEVNKDNAKDLSRIWMQQRKEQIITTFPLKHSSPKLQEEPVMSCILNNLETENTYLDQILESNEMET